jgi:hypothetical protein
MRGSMRGEVLACLPQSRRDHRTSFVHTNPRLTAPQTGTGLYFKVRRRRRRKGASKYCRWHQFVSLVKLSLPIDYFIRFEVFFI